MLVKRKNGSKRRQRQWQIAAHRRRLRWALIRAAAEFGEQNPQWHDYFFDMNFLLNRGLPIVEEHIAGVTSSGAMDLALAWAEEWPAMNASQRKVCLQAQTIIAAEVLRLTEAILLPRLPVGDASAERNGGRHGMSIPLAYVQAQNPPARSARDRLSLLELAA